MMIITNTGTMKVKNLFVAGEADIKNEGNLEIENSFSCDPTKQNNCGVIIGRVLSGPNRDAYSVPRQADDNQRIDTVN